MTDSNHNTWTTRHECAWLDGLGTHSTQGYNPKMLLQKYIKAAKKRKNWAGMVPEVVINHAIKLLKSH